jgi:hypothetical protein
VLLLLIRFLHISTALSRKAAFFSFFYAFHFFAFFFQKRKKCPNEKKKCFDANFTSSPRDGMTPKHACYALHELGSALSEATRLVYKLASEFKHLTKTLADDDAAHTEGARDFNQSLKIAAHRTVEKPLRSDAGTSVQQPQAQQLVVELKRLTTALAESNSESDSSLQQKTS